MALDERDTIIEERLAPDRRRFQRVRSVAVPLILLASLAAIALALFFQFMTERPLNLRPHTNRIAQDLLQLIVDSNVPPENVAVSPPQARKVEAGVWNYYRFNVTVPSAVSLPGLQEVVRRHAIQRYEQSVNATELAPGQLQLGIGDWVFADLEFVAAAPPPRQDLTAATGRLAEDVGAYLRDTGIPEEQIAWDPYGLGEDEMAHWHTGRVRVTLAPDVDIENIAREIEERMDGRDVTLRIETAEQGESIIRLAFAGRDAVDIVITEAGQTVLVSELPPLDALPMESEEYENGIAPELLPEAIADVGRPRIALILDDGGYGGDATERILALTPSLTLAILPDTPYATETAQRAGVLGFEIMLHMPMASAREDAVPFPGELSVEMDAEAIKEVTRAALDQIPGVLGVNNHTGSGFTTSPEAMRPFLEVVQEQGLYFVDSFTTPTSVGLDLAIEMNIPAVRRDVFLDNDPAPEAIALQMDKLIERAQKVGFAVGIAHFRDTTVAVLEELLERVRLAEVDIVHVSELMP